MEKDTKIEIARSFGQNLFLEAYKPINFFCSAKAEVSFGEAESVANELYRFCRKTVENEIEEYKREKEEEHTIQLEKAYQPPLKKVSEEHPKEWNDMVEAREKKSRINEDKGEPGDGYKQNSEK